MSLILLAGWLPATGLAQAPAEPSLQRSASVQPLAPQWNLGDKWTVEAVGRPLQARRGGALPAMRPIQWQFALSRFEKSLQHDCYRVEIRCLESKDGHPLTVLLVDRDSRALRQVTTEIPVPGGFQSMTVSYDFEAGQPGAVLGPLTALPIDLPAALHGGAKGLESYQYTASIGPPERKEVGELAFAHDVEQRVAPLAAADVRQLLTGAFAKSLEGEGFAKSLSDEALAAKPVTDVRLKSAGREIRQLWQSGQPWPIYCDNGYCVSRLVSNEPAQAAAPATKE
jgi:hypothetical protein